MERKISQLAASLNLKQHLVCNIPIYGPGDLEGHRGGDGNLYLVDLARLFPPEAPISATEKRAIYYNMLRPELVRNFRTALSSDAFSGWGMQDPLRKTHDQEVLECTRELHKTVIPRVAAELDDLVTSQKLPASQLNFSEVLHKHGVNMRHLGRVKTRVKNSEVGKELLIEMVVRVFKNSLRQQLRDRARSIKVTSDEPFKIIIVNFINTMLRHKPFGHDKRPTAWLSFVHEKVMAKFSYKLSQSAGDEMILLEMDYTQLLNKFCRKMGIELDASIQGSHLAPGKVLIVTPHIKFIQAKSTCMSTLELAEGMIHYLNGSACMSYNPQAAQPLLAEGYRRLVAARLKGQDRSDVLYSMAKCLMNMAALSRDLVKNDRGDIMQWLNSPEQERKPGTEILFSHLREANKVFCELSAQSDCPAEALLDYALNLVAMWKWDEAVAQLDAGFKKAGNCNYNSASSLASFALGKMEEIQEQNRKIFWTSERARALRLLAEGIIANYPRYHSNNSSSNNNNSNSVVSIAYAVHINSLMQMQLRSDRGPMASLVLYNSLRPPVGVDEHAVVVELISQNIAQALKYDPHALDKLVESAVHRYTHPQIEYDISLGALCLFAQKVPSLFAVVEQYLKQIQVLNFDRFSKTAKNQIEYDRLGLKALANVKEIDASTLPGPKCGMFLEQLLQLPLLRSLIVPLSQWSWSPETPLTHFQNLRKLFLSDARADNLRIMGPHLSNLTLLVILKSDTTDDALTPILQANCSTLTKLCLHSCADLTDTSLAAIGHLQKLRVLKLLSNRHEWTQQGISGMFQHLAKHATIRRLLLSNIGEYSDVTEGCLTHFPESIQYLLLDSMFPSCLQPALEKLAQVALNLTDFVLLNAQQPIGGLMSFFQHRGPKLRTFSYRSSSVHDDVAFFSVLQHAPQLESLKIILPTITPAGISEIAKHCNHLLRLSIRPYNRCEQLDNALVTLFDNNSGLRHLDMGNFPITNKHVAHLPPHLKRAMLATTTDDACLRKICKRCPQLRYFWIRRRNLGDYAVKQLSARLPQLKFLGLEHPVLTDVGLSYLGSLENLEVLQLDSVSHFDATSLLFLIAMKPDLVIVNQFVEPNFHQAWEDHDFATTFYCASRVQRKEKLLAYLPTSC
eukprot:TRINITY_DN1209_c0_g1_i3.p1 TRINITY_DN1209_c0_g1~~TRINITY_DN1209_c0_g1_i3.p1  ORF type:complete len:1191 (-),score=150.31 TRINITY_DN1209_c0_g1_i3:38-3436(-)